MKEITQVLFLLAVITVFLIVGGVALFQPAEEQIAPQIKFSEKLKEVEDVEEIKIREGQTREKEVFLENQMKDEEEIKGLSMTNWQWAESQKKLYKLTQAEVTSVLKELQELFPNKAERLKVLSFLRLGTPYLLGCLGEEIDRDKDPIFRLDVTDCTAFVLTNVALLHSQTIKEAKTMMQSLNYRPNSEVIFENRLHFTTDRNTISPYFQDITGEVLCGCSLKIVEVVLNKIKMDGKRLIDINWEKDMIFRYIPTQYITKTFFQRLPEAVGIAFVKERDEEIGLDIRHEGFLFGGELFFHASSAQEKVVSEDFFEYYFRSENQDSEGQKDKDSYLGGSGIPRFDGVVLFEIK